MNLSCIFAMFSRQENIYILVSKVDFLYPSDCLYLQR
nr:MAG TPA: hypothetical protein [Caudoviricetes sp.]